MLLAQKISLLFGAAVTLVIAVTLWSPWLQMSALNQQVMLLRAKLARHRRDPGGRSEPAQLAGSSGRAGRNLADTRQRIELAPGSPSPRACGRRPTGRWVPRGSHHVAHRRSAAGILLEDTARRDHLPVRHGGPTDRSRPLSPGATGHRRCPAPHGSSGGGVELRGHGPGRGRAAPSLRSLLFYVVTQRLVLSPVHALRAAAERVAAGDTEARSHHRHGRRVSETLRHLQRYAHTPQRRPGGAAAHQPVARHQARRAR